MRTCGGERWRTFGDGREEEKGEEEEVKAVFTQKTDKEQDRSISLPSREEPHRAYSGTSYVFL